MPFLTKNLVTVRNVNGDSITHEPGTVLSDWEVEAYARGKILEGSEWYRANFEALTEREAHAARVKSTQVEPPHVLNEGGAPVIIPAPFDDYVGLHPSEIVGRLREKPLDIAVNTRRYERAGLNRDIIVNYVHPAERMPFLGYDDMPVMEICEKLEVLGEQQIADIKIYEAAHQGRPMILTFEKEPVEENAETVTA